MPWSMTCHNHTLIQKCSGMDQYKLLRYFKAPWTWVKLCPKAETGLKSASATLTGPGGLDIGAILLVVLDLGLGLITNVSRVSPCLVEYHGCFVPPRWQSDGQKSSLIILTSLFVWIPYSWVHRRTWCDHEVNVSLHFISDTCWKDDGPRLRFFLYPLFGFEKFWEELLHFRFRLSRWSVHLHLLDCETQMCSLSFQVYKDK